MEGDCDREAGKDEIGGVEERVADGFAIAERAEEQKADGFDRVLTERQDDQTRNQETRPSD